MGWRRQQWWAVGPGSARPERTTGIAPRSRRHYSPRPGSAEARAAGWRPCQPGLHRLDRACRAGILDIPGGLYGAARRSGGRTAVRQAEDRALRARPALPLVADRNRGNRQHLGKTGRYRRRHPRSRQFRPDAFRRPEHRRRAVFGCLPGQRSPGLSLQCSRSRRCAAPGCRKCDARSGRPQPRAGYFPRRPPGHCRLGAIHHPGIARFIWNRPVGECDLDRGRGAAARSGRRL